MARFPVATTGPGGVDTPHLDRLVDTGDLLGYSVAVLAGDGTTRVATRGVTDPGAGRPVEPSTAYRLASLSKPVAGLLAAGLAADGVISPDDPIRRWIPELDGVRVLRRPGGALDDTAPMTRSITVHDLLTMTSGLGIRFDDTPLSRAMADAGVHPGPVPPRLDDATFLARLGELPLAFQPGAGWAYHTSTDVLSVVLARASGVPLDRLLVDRLTGPLDTPSVSFAPPAPQDRAPAYGNSGAGWEPMEPDGPAVPAMLTLSCGLWGNAAETARLLGELVRPSCLPAAAATAVRTPALTPTQLAAARPIVPEGYSFGHHVSVATEDDPQGPRAGAAGWSGGTGTLGIADPVAGRTVVLLTNRGFDGPVGTGALDAALDDLWSDVRER